VPVATANHQLKQQHIDSEAQRWDDIVDRIKQLLRFGCPNERISDEAVQQLTAELITMPSYVRFNVLGAEHPNLNGYPVPHEPIDILEFVAQFVGYAILDDGEPGIGYHRYDMMESFVPCGPDHPDARPYFHSCVDALREDYPEAEWLSEVRALEIVRSETERYHRQEAEWREIFPEDYEDEPHGPSNNDRTRLLLQQLVKDLQKETE